MRAFGARHWLVGVALLLGSQVAAIGEPAVRPPEEVFGFVPGSDRQLLDYEQLVAYLEELDRASDRLELREVGRSPLGKPMYVAFISAPANLARLERLREVNRRLALEPDLPTAERDQLVEEGRAFLMVTLSMHSSEVGPSQMLPLYAYELATTDDPTVLAQLAEVVLMVVPCHNPDGMDMVVHYYLERRGTPYEGAYLPRVYHRYVGHDNNRDFVTLTQEDTRVVDRLSSREWYPQVLVEKHQMGDTGPRYYVPPSHDPIAENVDETLWSWSAVFGAALMNDMTRDGLAGVATHWEFDNYWPGSTETSLWKNVVSLLTEAAGCRVATPVFVEPTELEMDGKGLAEHRKSVNLPKPWPGGRWRLSDIVTYELSSMRSLLRTTADHRRELLRLRNDLCRSEVTKGRTESPFAYVLPLEQHDRSELVRLAALLAEHGVAVYRLTKPVQVAETLFAAGDLVVPLAQPYRAFVKEVLEAQRFPVRHYTPGGEVIRPYDITSWSLPLHAGLRSIEVSKRSGELEAALEPLPSPWSYPDERPALDGEWFALAYPAGDNESFRLAFTALSAGIPVKRLSEATTVAGRPLAAGSFLLLGSRSNRERLRQLAGAAAIGAVVLTVLPEVATTDLTLPRVGLVETAFHDMDAGWTRFLLDSYGVPYRTLLPGQLATVELARELDVLVFPDSGKDVLLKGKYKEGDRYVAGDLPPELSKPIGSKGVEKLRSFLDAGGVVAAWGESPAALLEALGGGKDKGDEEEDAAPAVPLPVRDVAEELHKQGLFVPGTFLRATYTAGLPLTWGMPPTGGVFSRAEAVFATSIPVLDTDRRVVVTHPERELLLSGYLEGEARLAEKPIGVWVRRGKGQLVLYGFPPQFRASTPATYKLLFNALLLPRL